MPSAVDVVTICFSAELKMLQMQARSIERFMDPSTLGKCIFIINDPDHSEECHRFIDRIILPELTWLAARISIIDSADLDGALRGSGWLTQQALKLMSARHVATNHYLVLDAKNHFIAPVGDTPLFHGHRPRARTAIPTRNQRKWLDASLAYFDLDRSQGAKEAGATVTPYLMITDVCLSLLDEIERRGDQISELFSRPEPRPSEFFLYYAYIEAFYGGYAQLYQCDMLAQATLFTKHPATDAAFDSIMERTAHPDCWSFAIHRNRLPRLTAVQLERITGIWSRAGLVRPDEVEWFSTVYRPGEINRLRRHPRSFRGHIKALIERLSAKRSRH